MRISLFCLALCGAAFAADFKTLPEATAALTQARAEQDNVGMIAAVAAIPPLFGPAAAADQKAALALIGKCVGSKDELVRDAAFGALARLKVKGSTKYLGKWLNPPKKFPGEVPGSYIAAIKTAGDIADPGKLSKMLKLANHKIVEIAEAASRALGGYKTLPVKKRKPLVFDQIDRLALVSSRGRRRLSDEERDRREKLAAAIVGALQDLTGKSYQTGDGWSKWKERIESKSTTFE